MNLSKGMLALTAGGALAIGVVALGQVPAIAAPADAYGSLYTYNPARGSPGPGNGPEWLGSPGDYSPVWRNGRYRGNDPDGHIRQQLMRDR
jgi:hypothetical protein